MLQSSTLSRIDYKKRVAALKESLASGKLDPTTQATLRDRLEFFHELAAGGSVETDFPVSRMLTHAEFIALGIKDRFTINPAATPFGGKGPGQPHEYWLTLALENKRTAPVRILLPNRPDAKTPRPIVVALHGAGGSENMFFDSYGAGQMWKDCLARGWILVATRSPGLLSSPAVKEIVEKLAETYPIDKSKIFLVGHSMGAAQVVDLCQKHPGYFAGAAVLGGGGRVKDPKAFTTLPVFIGIGTQDFALKGAQNLKKALAESDAKRVTYKEYPDLEHLLIVREALPEVFKMFDGIVETKRN